MDNSSEAWVLHFWCCFLLLLKLKWHGATPWQQHVNHKLVTPNSIPWFLVQFTLNLSIISGVINTLRRRRLETSNQDHKPLFTRFTDVLYLLRSRVIFSLNYNPTSFCTQSTVTGGGTLLIPSSPLIISTGFWFLLLRSFYDEIMHLVMYVVKKRFTFKLSWQTTALLCQ